MKTARKKREKKINDQITFSVEVIIKNNCIKNKLEKCKNI